MNLQITNFFNNLYKNKFNTNFTISMIRLIKNKKYKISIIANKENLISDFSITIKLFDEENNKKSEVSLKLDKISNYLSKMYIYNSLPLHVDINFIDNLETFLEKVLIYHCYILVLGESCSLGLLARPVGIGANRTYEVMFLDTPCLIDIIVRSNTTISFYIYEKLM
jgi:hypothetical protein